MYGLLLFGGKVTVNHLAGGIRLGGEDGWIRLKAWPRIGVLVNQLRLVEFPATIFPPELNIPLQALAGCPAGSLAGPVRDFRYG